METGPCFAFIALLAAGACLAPVELPAEPASASPPVDGIFKAVPNRAEEELTAMFGETFKNPDYGAFKFERDADGRVTGFHLQSGRVRNLAFTRQD